MQGHNEYLKVAIAGAGFAGLATAVLLARQGHDVTVFDKFTEPQSVGAGVLLQPSGLAALRVLGIEGEVLAAGARIERLHGVTRFGWPVVDIRYQHWQPGSFGLGLHRGVLFDALWKAARLHGATIVAGQEVKDLAALQAKHDLVVVSDGCRSSLRCQTGLASTDRVYPWGAVWAVLEDPSGEHATTLRQWYRGAKEMLGIMPTGKAPGSDVPVVSLFWSVPARDHEAFLAAGLEAFKGKVRALHPGCDALLAQLDSMERLTWARYHDVVMPAYHTDRCVVIGDAAHATSPQLGQGTNLALLDAVALAECIAQSAALPAALERYTELRKQHLHFYGEASRRLTPLFQSEQALLPWLRDVFMNMSTKLPVAGTLTRDVLVGVRQGWLKAPPLPLPKA
ncbi:FAD-dependent oxidoreductase [Caenimonas aquaedulcis]|uniref:FAD-dependent monooxygenase n=1 Tax=Caenimonas aquaedulcis TaxID=2793270 RepID=A0A931H211_9BURK|nr:NAD(P)/FAD-dependent oxidoreductase [Caenimonas aquaedulcis]MBG9387112.1 FAD-dependent monooxygenase [Caenimonas aquaedulcis]